MTATDRSVIEGAARDARLLGKNERGHFLADAVIMYANALFKATVAIQPTGMVEMLADDPIAADLPMRIVAPVA
jgi:hypothetical protein